MHGAVGSNDHAAQIIERHLGGCATADARHNESAICTGSIMHEAQRHASCLTLPPPPVAIIVSLYIVAL
jgi:hypothetical protein